MLKELKEYLPDFKDGYFTTTDDVKVHYIESGSGEPLILSLGQSTNPCIFAFNFTKISKYFHVIAIETRGTGTSKTPTHGFRMSQIAKDIYDMLITLKIQKAYFMGHSMEQMLFQHLLIFLDKS